MGGGGGGVIVASGCGAGYTLQAMESTKRLETLEVFPGRIAIWKCEVPAAIGVGV